MKKQNKQTMTKLAVFAGATALVSLTPQAHAQTSVDALLNKLEQKGILTVDEAKELKTENAQDSATDLKKAMDSRFAMPDWVTGYKISGDFRGRYDHISGDNNALVDRARLRYRIRVGLSVSMMDNLEVGFRLGSGDYSGSFGGNPLSNNTTMQDNFSKKSIYVDAAYGKWTAINSGSWLLAATVGKMDNPFNFTPMVFDPDLTPEGAALTGGYTINDKHSIAFAGAAFVLDEVKTSTHDPMMYGGQVLWNAKWSPKWASSLGVGAFQIVNPEQLTTANVAYNNQGNTRNGSGILVNNYNPIIADANVTYTLDSFPLYHGKFPVKLAGEFIDNPGASQNNNGYWVGATFGKSGKKHTWDLSYRYEHLEADAWYDQLVDDDNGAFYQNAPTGGAAGYFGGTNVKGHLVKLNYSFTDSFTFTFSCFLNDLVNQTVYNKVNEPNNPTLRIMADLMWKF